MIKKLLAGLALAVTVAGCDAAAPGAQAAPRVLDAQERETLRVSIGNFERSKAEALFVLDDCLAELKDGEKGGACRRYSDLAMLHEQTRSHLIPQCRGLPAGQCPKLDDADPVRESEYTAALLQAAER